MPPKVSVAMITYNHEAFIEQAVRSVLMQETDFEYELVIGEDCSTDRTREILLRLQAEAPDRIRLLLHDTNQGMASNLRQVWEACDGEYVALLEGDDYWISPLKLQKQSDLLDDDPRCAISFHSARLLDQTAGREPTLTTKLEAESSTFSIDDFVFGRISSGIPTASSMLRKYCEALPAWFSNLRGMADLPIFFLTLQSTGGHACYLSDEMSVYRLHDNGIWTNRSREKFIDRKNNLKGDYLLMSNNAKSSQHGEYYNYIAFTHIFQLLLFFLREDNTEQSWSTVRGLLAPSWVRYYDRHFFRTMVKLILLTLGLRGLVLRLEHIGKA